MARPQHGPEFHKAVFRRLPADPAGSVGGDAYFNTIANVFRVFNGTIWQTFTAGAATTYAGAIAATGVGTVGAGRPSIASKATAATGTGAANNASVVHVP